MDYKYTRRDYINVKASVINVCTESLGNIRALKSSLQMLAETRGFGGKASDTLSEFIYDTYLNSIIPAFEVALNNFMINVETYDEKFRSSVDSDEDSLIDETAINDAKRNIDCDYQLIEDNINDFNKQLSSLREYSDVSYLDETSALNSYSQIVNMMEDLKDRIAQNESSNLKNMKELNSFLDRIHSELNEINESISVDIYSTSINKTKSYDDFLKEFNCSKEYCSSNSEILNKAALFYKEYEGVSCPTDADKNGINYYSRYSNLIYHNNEAYSIYVPSSPYETGNYDGWKEISRDTIKLNEGFDYGRAIDAWNSPLDGMPDDISYETPNKYSLIPLYGIQILAAYSEGVSGESLSVIYQENNETGDKRAIICSYNDTNASLYRNYNYKMTYSVRENKISKFLYAEKPFNNVVKELYNKHSTKAASDNNIYDIEITLDEEHSKNPNAPEAFYWFNKEGELLRTQNMYPYDRQYVVEKDGITGKELNKYDITPNATSEVDSETEKIILEALSDEN